MKRVGLFSKFILTITMIVVLCQSSEVFAAPPVPLLTYYSNERNDYFTTSTSTGIQSAIAAGYRRANDAVGTIYIFPDRVSGTVPLKLFWSSSRKDNFTTATAAGERDALAAGYVFVRNEGYIYPNGGCTNPGTVQLKTYYNDRLRDNFTTVANSVVHNNLLRSGYRFVRNQGCVLSGDQLTDDLVLYWHADRKDNFSTATTQGRQDAERAGYRRVRTEGRVYRHHLPGTVPLKLYWNDERKDNFVTATAAGERDAIAAGYRFVRNEGYVYPAMFSGLIPLKLYWSGSRTDNFSTASSAGEHDARGAGYRFVRNEGYLLPEPLL